MSRLGLAIKGVVASTLAVAGLVVFATAASAHDNGLQSVTAVCGVSPALGSDGDGATLTWTLYNNWPLTETGTYSTTQGTLSTTKLSIAASPAQYSLPPTAANQSFTQSLTAPELAALTPSSTINVGWSATWSDGWTGTGTLSTTLAALDLPNGCVSAPSTTTTQVSKGSVVVGTSVTDTATVTGNATEGVPTGTVTFTQCGPTSSDALCVSGSPVGSAVALSSGKATSASFTPSAVGTYCFAAVYTPASGSSYETSSDNLSGAVQSTECFAVTASPANFTVTKTDVPASGTSVAPSSTINYTVAIKNVGTGAGSATVTDVVPPSLTVSGTPACAVTSPDTCSVANTTGSTWTFTVSLAAGDTATVTFAAKVAAAATGTITNTATITSGPCTTSAGCSSSVSNPVAPTTSAAVLTPTTPAATTAAATTSPTTSPSTTSLAATGALLTEEWMVGLAALLLGSGLVLLARWRRRSPQQASSKE